MSTVCRKTFLPFLTILFLQVFNACIKHQSLSFLFLIQTLPATTTTPDFLATTLDFEREYNRLLAKLANISDSMFKTGRDSKSDISSTNLPSTNVDTNGEETAASADEKETAASADEKETAASADEKETDGQGPQGVEEETSTEAEDPGDQETMASGPEDPGVGEFLQDSPRTSTPSTSASILSEDFVSKLQDLGFPDSWLDPKEDDEVRGQEDDLLDDKIKEILLNLLALDDKASDLTPKRSSRSTRSKVVQERSRRHAGLHDAAGIQRVISTGTLAPPLSPVLDDTPSDPNSIDLIFATYWFYPKPHKVRLKFFNLLKTSPEYTWAGVFGKCVHSKIKSSSIG